MNFHGSFVALICYLVTVLLLFLIGDIFSISWLQFIKQPHIQSNGLTQISYSIFPFLLAAPVYILVWRKTKHV